MDGRVQRTHGFWQSIEMVERNGKQVSRVKSREDLAKIPGGQQVLTWIRTYNPDLLDKILPSKKCKWTLKKCIADAKKYKTKTEWQQKSYNCHRAAKKNNWYEQSTKHTGGHRAKRSLKDCIKDAQKYVNKDVWRKKSLKVYEYARYHGWLDKCSKHMPKNARCKYFKCLQNGKVYLNQSIAEAELSINKGMISAVLNKKRKSTGGFHFVYCKADGSKS